MWEQTSSMLSRGTSSSRVVRSELHAAERLVMLRCSPPCQGAKYRQHGTGAQHRCQLLRAPAHDQQQQQQQQQRSALQEPTLHSSILPSRQCDPMAGECSSWVACLLTMVTCAPAAKAPNTSARAAPPAPSTTTRLPLRGDASPSPTSCVSEDDSARLVEACALLLPRRPSSIAEMAAPQSEL